MGKLVVNQEEQFDENGKLNANPDDEANIHPSNRKRKGTDPDIFLNAFVKKHENINDYWNDKYKDLHNKNDDKKDEKYVIKLF